MKIGLISDIHGNIHALTRVLQELYAHPVDIILCAGDLVGFGAHPGQVIHLLRHMAIPCAAGNYDAAVAWDLPQPSQRPSSPALEPLRRAALAWAQAHLSQEQKHYLRNLPMTLSFKLDGLHIQVMHAGLDALDDWYMPDDPDRMARLAARLAADVVIMGHTHHPYAFRSWHEGKKPGSVRTTLFINPGSVGRPLDGDPRAAFAIFDTRKQQVDFHRIEYDVDAAARAVEKSGMPLAIARLLREATRPDPLLAAAA